MPESARGGGLDLYSWESATGLWSLERRLLDDVAVLDATLFRYQERWYLFGTLRGDGSYEKLRIWWADSLEGEWHMHAMNPAKVDVGSARSAGAFFKFGGAWYRPAQDCREGYGGALAINRIDVLTPSEFFETTVSRVEPDVGGSYPHGLHTLAVLGEYILIDGRKTGFRMALPLMKLQRRCQRLFHRNERWKQHS
jgi:hypothetical protein